MFSVGVMLAFFMSCGHPAMERCWKQSHYIAVPVGVTMMALGNWVTVGWLLISGLHEDSFFNRTSVMAMCKEKNND